MNTTLAISNTTIGTTSFIPIYKSNNSVLNNTNIPFNIANKNKGYFFLIFFGIVYAYNYLTILW